MSVKSLKFIFILLTIFSAIFCHSSFADPFGCWTTIDDVSKKPKSIVQISKAGKNGLTAKVVKILFTDDGTEPSTRRCKKCPSDDPRYNKLIEGMTIIKKVKKESKGYWSGGEILDPKTGDSYSVEITENEQRPNELEVRGYLMFSLIGRTQVWKRTDAEKCNL